MTQTTTPEQAMAEAMEWGPKLAAATKRQRDAIAALDAAEQELRAAVDDLRYTRDQYAKAVACMTGAVDPDYDTPVHYR